MVPSSDVRVDLKSSRYQYRNNPLVKPYSSKAAEKRHARRQDKTKSGKKAKLWLINKQFGPFFKAAWPRAIVFQQLLIGLNT
jgi:hypothetical protein